MTTKLSKLNSNRTASLKRTNRYRFNTHNITRSVVAFLELNRTAYTRHKTIGVPWSLLPPRHCSLSLSLSLSTLKISLHSNKNHMQDNRIGDYKQKVLWRSHKSKVSLTQKIEITPPSLELVFGVIMWYEFLQYSDWGQIIHFTFKATHTHMHLISYAASLNAKGKITQPAAAADSDAKSHNPSIHPTYRISFKGEIQ